MSAALRTTQAEPSMRPLVAAFGGIVVAATIVGAAGLRPADDVHVRDRPRRRGRPGPPRPRLATPRPPQSRAPVLHDRGWATAPSVAVTAAPVLHDRGLATAPSPPVTPRSVHDRGWATAPSAASGHSRFGGSGGSNGTRVAAVIADAGRASRGAHATR